MNQSAELQDLYAALAIAQGEIENATKDAENPAFKRGRNTSKYADLSSIRDAYRIPLSKNGLALIQVPSVEGKRVTVLTRLAHKSGQFIEEPLSLMAANETPHAIGSAITYARRYAALCFVGVAPEDDDGNAASQGGSPEVESQEPPQQETDLAARIEEERRLKARHEAKLAYIERAKKEMETCKIRPDLAKWWQDSLQARKDAFDGQDDPEYARLKQLCEEKGKSLPAETPAKAADAIPDTPSSGKPRPSLAVLRITLREALSAAAFQEACDDAYAKVIEPFEGTFNDEELMEFVRMVDARKAAVAK